jgi:hypothetical protein
MKKRKRRPPLVIHHYAADGTEMIYTAKELRLAGFDPIDIWLLRHMAKADQAEARRERAVARRRKTFRVVGGTDVP